ncbi:PREDICTED: mitochondrial sodium/hydrogen exchanger 9B2-like [Gekko japonicus]|uniref:Mitochondrial sodium/hydrogen exchanger 9B2-like n=1 Tax=Gekko japonicus TaxID=146911 RepID=A0ABM1JIG6_GEKJA|nr:PREDICTED: mitochondrial sodium/hydrogen exchanger 9B2-like [Gekko japonicus]
MTYFLVCEELPPLRSSIADTIAVYGSLQGEDSSVFGQHDEDSQDELKLSQKLRHICSCPPKGIIASTVTNVAAAALIWAVVWSITFHESLPGRNLFGLLFLFFSAVLGGKVMGQIKLPGMPPLPRLFGMLFAGFLIRNIPFTSKLVHINVKWSANLRNMALSIILALAGLGLDPQALNKLKVVCLRMTFGPCVIEACTAAVASHFIMHLPWAWGFMLGFVLGAVSPAIVVLSMLVLQEQGYGTDKGIPTLLIAASSCDDVVAITGFNIFLGMAFSKGSPFLSLFYGVLQVVVGAASGGILGLFIWYFPSKDQTFLVWKRAFFVMGLSVFAVLSSKHFGFPGSGGLCTLVLSFMGGLAWSNEKREVEEIIAAAWEIFQPFLFSLIGAEISIVSIGAKTFGLCLATMGASLLVRIIAAFSLVSCAGFDFKEKLFIALAWIPKATVQAAIGSVALDTAREHHNPNQEEYGLNILTVAFLAILITAPTGALLIGLTGPKLLRKADTDEEEDYGDGKGGQVQTPTPV